MTPGYSKLLINENVVPDTGAHPETTALDLNMMTVGSCERTQGHWTRLLERAGLKILNIWTVTRGVENLIECVCEN
ncbi:S-adenosyl-L-methionine-dependent methyltransferase [Penicillium malachiteum]|uniref:S-adenosyl-L-methionine-dependent methyltransferase n=1 Tax=Penicillium malachiteum TaxID=1324776 RepID=UPI0025468D30|nr:S-adenosyl-L-methionine-dependent methyltransferase [Penicillium malachiteum]KAJ5731623.1 S-adenosyl-L-methionine-dependent methyltransferase [Penicillium malachiteum]